MSVFVRDGSTQCGDTQRDKCYGVVSPAVAPVKLAMDRHSVTHSVTSVMGWLDQHGVNTHSVARDGLTDTA